LRRPEARPRPGDDPGAGGVAIAADPRRLLLRRDRLRSGSALMARLSEDEIRERLALRLARRIDE
jgi:hypothetical protein